MYLTHSTWNKLPKDRRGNGRFQRRRTIVLSNFALTTMYGSAARVFAHWPGAVVVIISSPLFGNLYNARLTNTYHLSDNWRLSWREFCVVVIPTDCWVYVKKREQELFWLSLWVLIVLRIFCVIYSKDVSVFFWWPRLGFVWINYRCRLAETAVMIVLTVSLIMYDVIYLATNVFKSLIRLSISGWMHCNPP